MSKSEDYFALNEYVFEVIQSWRLFSNFNMMQYVLIVYKLLVRQIEFIFSKGFCIDIFQFILFQNKGD